MRSSSAEGGARAADASLLGADWEVEAGLLLAAADAPPPVNVAVARVAQYGTSDT